jgi:hypothetical protein
MRPFQSRLAGMKHLVLASLAILLACANPASAQGFAVRDLQQVEAAALSLLGAGYIARAEADRLTLTCPECEGSPMIDLRLGRQTDGTEERVRSGKTSIADLEALCRQKSDACRIGGLSIAPAIGWLSTYPLGKGSGSTAVIIRDGDLLTIRVISQSGPATKVAMKKLLDGIAGKIVGG